MDSNYDNCLLKAGIQHIIIQGIDKNGQPLYVLLGNLIDANHIKVIVAKLQNLLETNRPFKQYILIYTAQINTEFKENDFKELIRELIKFTLQNILEECVLVSLKSFKQIDIIHPYLSQQHFRAIIPGKGQQFVEKTYVTKTPQDLDEFDIQLHQSIIATIGGQGNIYKEPFYGRELQNYPISKNGIPVVLEEILQYYKVNEDYLKSEGVFRKSGSAMKEQELEEKLRMQDYQALFNFDPDVVSNLLKNWMSKLKYPVFPYQIYETLTQTKTDINDLELLEMFSIMFAYMTQVSRNTVKRFAEFLNHVAQFEETNKMGLENLSIVFTPCFFRAEFPNLEKDIVGSKIVVKHFLRLIQNVDYFLKIPKQVPQALN